MKMSTRLAQAGCRQDPLTGALSTPIYHATTFSHPELGQSTGYDYTRSGNPTRRALEEVLADLEGGARAFAFASGMAAVSTVMGLFCQGDHIVASDDLYGGTYRLFERMLSRQGIAVTYADTSNVEALQAAITPVTRALFVETPTNPTMKITDLRGVAAVAGAHDIFTIVDNTFMTPFFQRPLELGADIVIHSATKYLGGHNDVLAGVAVCRSPELAERLYELQNGVGATLGPQDCWLLLRGLKTLALRMNEHERNAAELSRRLALHHGVGRVLYPGLEHHPGREIHRGQATGFGGMLSFEVLRADMVAPFLKNVEVVTFAESLGSVETLVTFPARQTHADVPPDVRAARGVSDRLLRLSVGIEDVEDLWRDLDRALTIAARAAI